MTLPELMEKALTLPAACAESLRLSSGLSRQLLPGGAEEGLWSHFRLYSLRFLLFLLAAVGVAFLEVLLRRATL